MTGNGQEGPAEKHGAAERGRGETLKPGHRTNKLLSPLGTNVVWNILRLNCLL